MAAFTQEAFMEYFRVAPLQEGHFQQLEAWIGEVLQRDFGPLAAVQAQLKAEIDQAKAAVTQVHEQSGQMKTVMEQFEKERKDIGKNLDEEFGKKQVAIAGIEAKLEAIVDDITKKQTEMEELRSEDPRDRFYFTHRLPDEQC